MNTLSQTDRVFLATLLTNEERVDAREDRAIDLILRAFDPDLGKSLSAPLPIVTMDPVTLRLIMRQAYRSGAGSKAS